MFFGSDFERGGEISVAEAYVEGRVPLAVGAKWADYLGLEMAIRASDYEELPGTLQTWKFGAEWQTVFGLRFRAMLQRAIRAPGVGELFQQDQFAGFFFNLGPIFDQCSASRDPVGNGLADLCIAQGIPAGEIGLFEADFFPTEIEFAANKGIDAEEADSFTAGVVWQLPSAIPMSISLDYFDIELDNALGLLFAEDAMALCFASRDPADDFCQAFSRDISGNINSAQIKHFNAAFARSEGLDLALDGSWELPALATFGSDANLSLSLVTTHYLSAGTQATPLTPFFDCPGKFGSLCGDFVFLGALPEFRSNTRLSYSSGPVGASIRWTHIDSMQNSENEFRALTGRPAGSPAVERLPSKNYFDLTINTDLSEDWLLTFGIVNLFDEAPPFVGDGSTLSANTDPRTYDILGRRYFLRLGLSLP